MINPNATTRAPHSPATTTTSTATSTTAPPCTATNSATVPASALLHLLVILHQGAAAEGRHFVVFSGDNSISLQHDTRTNLSLSLPLTIIVRPATQNNDTTEIWKS